MTICFPHPPGASGPGSFQIRFEQILQSKGWKISYKGSNEKPDLIFIVGGTKHILWLLFKKIQGVSIIYRLDGIRWLHRKKKVGLKNFLLAEYRNFGDKIIHAFLADKIVYQSVFVQNWWNKKGFRKRKNVAIIYNGVVLPANIQTPFNTTVERLVVLEGNIDYSPYAVQLLNDLALKLRGILNLELYGKFEFAENKKKINEFINYKGFLPREMVNDAMKGSIYLSLDINPACPNTVIEALSCGAPVVGFDTGSLKELVPPRAGEIVPYGGDPWKLNFPDQDALINGIRRVKENYTEYSKNARKVAEEKYSIDDMARKYLDVLIKTI